VLYVCAVSEQHHCHCDCFVLTLFLSFLRFSAVDDGALPEIKNDAHNGTQGQECATLPISGQMIMTCFKTPTALLHHSVTFRPFQESQRGSGRRGNQKSRAREKKRKRGKGKRDKPLGMWWQRRGTANTCARFLSNLVNMPKNDPFADTGMHASFLYSTLFCRIFAR
jgi:hypothetical protein